MYQKRNRNQNPRGGNRPRTPRGGPVPIAIRIKVRRKVEAAIARKISQGLPTTPIVGLAKDVDLNRVTNPPRRQRPIGPRNQNGRYRSGRPPRFPNAPRPTPSKINQMSQQITKAENSNVGKKLVVEVASAPFTNNVPFDVYGLQFMIEFIIAFYSVETDILTEVQPFELNYYLTYVSYVYLNHIGALVGTTLIPAGGEKITFAVPYALAKWLEYNANYSANKGTTSKRLVYQDIFNPAPVDTGVGLFSQNLLTRPAYFPSWNFYPQTSADPGTPQTVIFLTQSAGWYNFLTFVADFKRIEAITGEVNKRPNTIPQNRIPTTAPDSSAYAVLARVMDGTTTYREQPLTGIDDNFDPEVALLFMQTVGLEGEYNSSTTKSVPLPIMNPVGVCFDAIGQLASVFVFCAQHFQGDYVKGPIRSAFPISTPDGKGIKLKTLYPQEQAVSGVTLSQVVVSDYTQLMNNKTDIADTELVYITLLMISAFSAFQKRMNQVEVCHWNCPCTLIFAGPPPKSVVVPQLFYLDANFSTVQLPALTAAAISAIGVVVVDGTLRIPFSNYNGEVTSATQEETVIGPLQWANKGFNIAVDEYFGDNNLYTVSLGNILGDSPVIPALIADTNTRPPTYYNLNPTTGTSGNMGLNYAAEPNPETPVTIAPALPTSGVASFLIQQLMNFYQLASYSQTIPLAQVRAEDFGDYTVMTMTHATSNSDGNIIPINANGTGDVSTITALNTLATTIVTPTPLTPLNAAIGAVFGQGNVLDQSRTDASKRSSYIRWKKHMLGDTAVTVDDMYVDLYGQHGTDLPWSTGGGGVIRAMSQQFLNPTSTFSKTLNKANEEGDYDVLSLVKRYAEPILSRSMKGANLNKIPLRSYAGQVGQSKNTGKGQGIVDKISGGVNTAIKVGEGVAKGVKAVSSILEMF